VFLSDDKQTAVYIVSIESKDVDDI